MKRFTLVLFFLALSCANVSLHAPDPRLKRLKEASTVLMLTGTTLWEYAPCLDYEGPVNGVFFGAQYGWRFAGITGTFQTFVLGDSTQDIDRSYQGYFSSSSVNFAVAGNTSCDFTAQMKVIPPYLTPPSVVLLAAIGGNDMAGQRATNTQIAANFQYLTNKIRTRWPGVKIHGIYTHPTEVSYANANKKAVQDLVAPYLDCGYDPLPLFGVAEGQPANLSDMLGGTDAIHYNEAVAFKIKSALTAKCGTPL